MTACHPPVKLGTVTVLAILTLALAGPASGQTIDPVGTPSQFDIATWNIEWFGDSNNGPSNDDEQRANVQAVIAQSAIDLWGVQEIADAADFAAMLTALGPDFDGELATNSGGSQRIGFVYDTRVIRVRQVQHILETFLGPFAGRPPLQMEADVMLPDTTVVMTFIVVHMKAFSDATSYERRVEAASRLKNHIDFTSLSSRPVVLLGDYNDLLESSITSGRTSPYAPFLEDDTDYRALTLEIERSGEGSFCSNLNCSARGSLIDHITITNELFDWYSEGSTRVLTTLPGAIVLYGGSTSDHLPVMASFRRPSTTSIADERPVGAFLLGAPFPNPTADRVFLPLHLNAPAPVRLALYDVLGREVEVLVDGMLPAGTHHVPVFLDRRPAGTYVVRGSDGQARRIVRVR